MNLGDQACPERVEGTADWVLDLEPEGGDKGGDVGAEGTPEQVSKEPRSHTGHDLAPLLQGSRTEVSAAFRRKKRVSSASMLQREVAE